MSSSVFLSGADVLRVRSETSSPAGEVWHLATLRLPCWVLPSTAEANGGASPTQPMCTFIIRLAPTGALLQTRSCSPRPDSPPSARDLVELLRDAMLKTGKRPEVVEFSDATEAVHCTRSLESLGVRTKIVPEHAGLTNYAREFAIKFSTPRPDGSPPLARITQQGDEPGLRTGGGGVGMTDALVRAFYQRADALAISRPWERVAERQTLRFQIGSDADSQPLWVAVIGQDWIMKQQALARANQDPRHAGPPRLGLAIYRKRADAESRLMIPFAEAEAHELRSKNPQAPLPPVPAAVQNTLDQTCNACGKVGGADSRCTGCADAYYCNEACQREAFPKHAAACKASPVTRPVLGTPWATSKGELLVLFVDPLRFSFADHADVRALGVTPHSNMSFAMALSFRGGAPGHPPSRPNAEELKNITRALAAVEAFTRECSEDATTPIAMTTEVNVSLGGRDSDVTLLRAGGGGSGGGGEGEEVTGGGNWWDATGDAKSGRPPIARMRTDPMVTREEAKAFATRKADAAKRMGDHAASLGAALTGAFAAVAAEPTMIEGGDDEADGLCGFCCSRKKGGKGAVKGKKE